MKNHGYDPIELRIHSWTSRTSSYSTAHENNRGHGPHRPTIREHTHDAPHFLGVADNRPGEKSPQSYSYPCWRGYVLCVILHCT